ncbi:hypothetical protein [Falsirhodobacter deserti]|uniref:hypothetical protein n=1 Tax=Falsirhodobacter deserti TaxID=1365611 RepID=UPI0013E3E518|nr:hypothetical protein [Falsirhodobacter deserti]
MLRLFAAMICLGLGGPATARPPVDLPHVTRDASRMAAPREEDAAEVWLRESAPRR